MDDTKLCADFIVISMACDSFACIHRPTSVQHALGYRFAPAGHRMLTSCTSAWLCRGTPRSTSSILGSSDSLAYREAHTCEKQLAYKYLICMRPVHIRGVKVSDP